MEPETESDPSGPVLQFPILSWNSAHPYYFPVCAKFGPRPCVRPRFIAHLPKPGLFVSTSCGFSSSSARSRTASRATVDDDLRAVTATEADSLYDLLGISESGTTSEIRQAYRQLVLKYHPDVSPPDRAKEYTKRFIQVQEAYETLSDPTSRALYCRDMAIGGRKPFCYIQVQHGTVEWKLWWESQIDELQRRSTEKSPREHVLGSSNSQAKIIPLFDTVENEIDGLDLT